MQAVGPTEAAQAWLQLECIALPRPSLRPAKQTVLITLSLQRGELRAEGLGQPEAGGRRQAVWGYAFLILLLFCCSPCHLLRSWV